MRQEHRDRRDAEDQAPRHLVRRRQLRRRLLDQGGQAAPRSHRPFRPSSYLGVKNSEFGNDIAKAIGGAKILKGLKTLDLSLGAMTDEGAEALAAAKGSLAHLECLDLTRNFLYEEGHRGGQRQNCKKVVTEKQEEADSDGDDTYYYVSIAE